MEELKHIPKVHTAVWLKPINKHIPRYAETEFEYIVITGEEYDKLPKLIPCPSDPEDPEENKERAILVGYYATQVVDPLNSCYMEYYESRFDILGRLLLGSRLLYGELDKWDIDMERHCSGDRYCISKFEEIVDTVDEDTWWYNRGYWYEIPIVRKQQPVVL